MFSHCVCPSIHIHFLTATAGCETAGCFHITSHVSPFLPLCACYRAFHLFLPPPPWAGCLSLINLYNSLRNCMTFTVCLGSVSRASGMEVQLHKDGFTLSFLPFHFFLLSPFHISDFHPFLFFNGGIPEPKGKCRPKWPANENKKTALIGQEQQENLAAPAWGSEIKAFFETSLLLLHILHLWTVGNIDFFDKKALTVTW